MITDLLNSTIFLMFVMYGFRRPYVAMAGVIWIDLYKPQLLSQSFLYEKPLSFIMVAFFMMVLVLNSKKIIRPSKMSFVVIVLTFMCWITITTHYAEFPVAAAGKYNVAFKTILFALFIPFVLSERKEIELFVWVLVGALGSYMFLAGVKSILGGGGYGVSLINDNPSMTWNEGSTLACQGISLIPLLYFSGKNSLFIEHRAKFKIILVGIAFCCLLVLVGTEARTGLIALAVLGMFAIYYSKKKFKLVLTIMVALLLAVPFLPDAWLHRMSSMENTNKESSALGRIVVWRWTIDYANQHPFMGGGFNSYLANAGQLGQYQKPGEVEIDAPHGKAFHNIFIEVLGEQGYVGLTLYIMILAQTLLTLRAIFKSKLSAAWQQLLGLCMFISLVVYCVGGLFIGVAFFPWVFYMHGLSIALNNSYRKELLIQGESR